MEITAITLTLKDEDLDDDALIRIDDGRANAIGTPVLQSGAFAGFQPFTSADPGCTGHGV